MMKNTIKSEQEPESYLGIDVGKRELHVHLITTSGLYSESFTNDLQGIRSLIPWLKKLVDYRTSVACMEQTGHYSRDVAKALFELGVMGVHVVNPWRIKAFGNQKLRRNKSDSADARLIAQFVKSEWREILLWQPPSVDQEKITALSRYSESLVADTARLKTKYESTSDLIIKRSLKRRIKAQEAELKSIREQIAKIIRDNKKMKSKYELLMSIPGIGETTAYILLGELPDIEHFENARQLAAWAGVTPRHFVSGTSGKTKTPITKVGSAHLRRALFLPAMTAKSFNPLLRDFAQRLEENGKKPKQIIIAVMRKLLHQIYGILKSNQPFNPNKQAVIHTP